MTAAEGIATVGGLGRIVPGAPGPLASFLTLFVAWGLVAVHGQPLVLVAAAATSAVGLWGAELYSRQHGSKDPSECVVDEVAGQLIACAVTPRTFVLYGLAFLLFRLFDIVKPWPIRMVERRVAGGIGIMLDDVVAALYAVALLLIAEGVFGVRP